jgi:transcriptional regulator with XRE-family HTH domain
MNIEIANRLVQLRKQHNLSQEELAEKLGISRQAVSKWERAESSPDTDNLISIAKLYNISLDDLLKTDESQEDLRKQEQEKRSEEEKNGWENNKTAMQKFPYPIVATVLFFIIGFVFNEFKFAWLVFLTVPIYYWIANSLRKK